MVFSSHIFIYYFLPAALLGYYALAAAPQCKVLNKSSRDWNVERNTKVTLIRKDAVEQEITERTEGGSNFLGQAANWRNRQVFPGLERLSPTRRVAGVFGPRRVGDRRSVSAVSDRLLQQVSLALCPRGTSMILRAWAMVERAGIQLSQAGTTPGRGSFLPPWCWESCWPLSG